MKNPSAILITGASSGIGAALALAYAKAGRTLFLTGRNKARLTEVAKECTKLGAKTIVKTLDIKSKTAVRNWVAKCDQIVSLDLVIANAGISSFGRDFHEAMDRDIMSTNIEGVLNTIYPAIDAMRTHKRGQIAIISSVASFISLSRAPAYCSSKSAVRVFGEALRQRLKRENIAVNTVCPGFIATPLVEKNPYRMPFMLTADKAAKIIMQGLVKDKGLIVFPKIMQLLINLLQLFPKRLHAQLIALVDK